MEGSVGTIIQLWSVDKWKGLTVRPERLVPGLLEKLRMGKEQCRGKMSKVYLKVERKGEGGTLAFDVIYYSKDSRKIKGTA